MRVSRAWCPNCCDEVLFSGLTHTKCGYTTTVPHDKPELVGTGARKLQVQLSRKLHIGMHGKAKTVVTRNGTRKVAT